MLNGSSNQRTVHMKDLTKRSYFQSFGVSINFVKKITPVEVFLTSYVFLTKLIGTLKLWEYTKVLNQGFRLHSLNILTSSLDINILTIINEKRWRHVHLAIILC